MKGKLLVAALVVVVAMLLGATVLREPIALAAQTVSAEIIGPLDADGNVRVHEQGARWIKVAENLTVVNGQPFTHQTPWVNVSDCGQILFFTRSTFALHPPLEFSADKSSVDWTVNFDNWTRPVDPGNNGWATYPAAHLGIRFPWARFNWRPSSTWADSTMTTVWMVCQPK